MGAAATVVALLWHLYSTEPRVFVTVVGITVAVVLVEVLYFDRRSILEELRDVEGRMETRR